MFMMLWSAGLGTKNESVGWKWGKTCTQLFIVWSRCTIYIEKWHAVQDLSWWQNVLLNQIYANTFYLLQTLSCVLFWTLLFRCAPNYIPIKQGSSLGKDSQRKKQVVSHFCITVLRFVYVYGWGGPHLSFKHSECKNPPQKSQKH